MRTEFSTGDWSGAAASGWAGEDDGTRAVCGGLQFSGDGVCGAGGGTIANGKIRSMDTAAAEKMPGVLAVLHHDNIGPLFHIVCRGRMRD